MSSYMVLSMVMRFFLVLTPLVSINLGLTSVIFTWRVMEKMLSLVPSWWVKITRIPTKRMTMKV